MPAMLVTGDPCTTENVLVSLHNNPNHAWYNIVNALICTVFSLYFAGNEENWQLLHVFLITNGKEYQSTEQTVLSHCTSRTV